MTAAGLEVALLRAWLAERGAGEREHWGGRLRAVETDITVPVLRQRGERRRWLERCAAAGFSCFKVKVSGEAAADLALLRGVDAFLRDRLERFSLRLDGNQGFDPRGCLELAEGLQRAGVDVELLEEPLPRGDAAGYRSLRGRLPWPVVLDESVFGPGDCRRAVEEGLGDGVNIKVAKSGIAGSAAILQQARRAGWRLMVGCMTETMVGLSAGIALAAGTGAFDYIDLDSVHLLEPGEGEGGPEVRGSRFVYV
jgi:L-alanine-DL-glutamate epimerase-like enolase superfamily enzyme